MAMHTRRELLRTSLLAGGALCTPRVLAQVSTGTRTLVAGRYAVAVGGGIAGIESFQILSQPPPTTTKLAAPTAVPAPAAIAGRAGTVTAINPAALQSLPPYRFSFGIAWDGISQPIANWVVGAVNHAPSLQDGSFYVADFNGTILSQDDWTGGVVSQVTWPGCEVTSTAAAFPVITVDAATMTRRKYNGPLNVSKLGATRQRYWRACDFVVSSSVNINTSGIASVSPLTLVPTVYGGTVALGYDVAAAGPTALAPFQTAAMQAGVLPMPGLSTDLVIRYGPSTGWGITLRNCRVLSVNSASPRSVVNMSYADASLTL